MWVSDLMVRSGPLAASNHEATDRAAGVAKTHQDKNSGAVVPPVAVLQLGSAKRAR
jgi:hypothetical protein